METSLAIIMQSLHFSVALTAQCTLCTVFRTTSFTATGFYIRILSLTIVMVALAAFLYSIKGFLYKIVLLGIAQPRQIRIMFEFSGF